MQILPVLDLMQGVVVRGVGGRRDEYRPIQSQLVSTAEPSRVAAALRAEFGFDQMYVADLDAIRGAEPAWEVYRQLLQAGWGLWIDAGLCGSDRAAQLAAMKVGNKRIDRIVIGLESVAGPYSLRQMVSAVGAERAVFSLDLQAGKPLLTASSEWPSAEPLAIMDAAVQAGLRTAIILDLAHVGEMQGLGTAPLVQQVRQRWPHLTIVSGGGVRSAADLQVLSNAGCHFALVASALHDRRLQRPDIELCRSHNDAASKPLSGQHF